MVRSRHGLLIELALGVVMIVAAFLFGAQTAGGTPGGRLAAVPQAQPASLAAASPTTVDSARSASVQWAFTQAGGHPDALVAEGINSASHEVAVAIYAFNRAADVSALMSAQRRCGCVRVISDAEQSRSAEQSNALRTLQTVGIPIKVDAHSGIMHMKVVEIDRQVVYEGSFNWTNAASTINDEILVRVASSEFAQATAEEYDRMWNDPKRFRDWQPSPVPASPVVSTF